MRKKIIYIISIIVIAFFMFIFAISGLRTKFNNGFIVTNSYFYINIALIVLTFYVLLFIHEFTHLLVFRFHKIGGIALYLNGLIFIKDQKQFKIKFQPKLLVMFGGMFIPNFNSITNDDDLENAFIATKKSLLIAPLVTIIFGFILIVLYFIILSLSNDYYLIGFMNYISITGMVFTLLGVRTSFKSTKEFYGDFVAHSKLISNQSEFFIEILLNYLSLTCNNNLENREFLQIYLRKYIQDISDYKNVNALFVYQYMHYIVSDLLKIIDLKDDKIYQKLMKLKKEAHCFSNYNVNNLELNCLYVKYLYKIGLFNESFELYQRLARIKTNQKSKYSLYLLKECAHNIGIENNSIYLEMDFDDFFQTKYPWILQPLLKTKNTKIIFEIQKTNSLSRICPVIAFEG